MRRARLAGYGYTYIACLLLWSIVLGSHHLGGREEGQDPGTALGILPGAAAFALLALPIRMLLLLFPEWSESTAVRLVRRMLFGVLCGPVPPLIVMIAIARSSPVDKDDAAMAVVMGAAMGLLAGAVDALLLDRSAGPAPPGS